MRITLFLLICLFLCPLLPAQVLMDNFDYPNTIPFIPGWTAASGTWTINNKRLATSGSGWKYITRDGLTATNCVMDAEFFLIGSALQFGGLTARFANANSTVMVKIQNNSSGPAWDRVYVYEKPGGATNQVVPAPLPTSVFGRMIVLDSEAWMLVDADKDGIYEMVTGPHALTSTLGSGKCGMNGYGITEMDNFEFFDAVLMEEKGAKPKVGTTYKMTLRTPPPPTPGPPGNPYFCLAARSNAGIHIGSRKIPVSYDFLWDIALTNSVVFPNCRGLTDKAGKASPSFAIPNDPLFIGLAFYIAGFTLDSSKPFGIGHISNEHHIKVVP